MTQKEKEMLLNIESNMENGNWTDAERDYKSLNITAAEFQDWLQNVHSAILKDWALLGFYCRERTPMPHVDRTPPLPDLE